MLGKTNWYKMKSRFGNCSEVQSLKQRRQSPPVIREVKKCSKEVKDKQKETEAVLFVPCTPGGVLQKKIQEAEDKFTAGSKLKRIRVVERGGLKLKDLLAGDPWSKECCERIDCLPCREKEKAGGVNCQTENITYSISCKECKRQGRIALYWGESARTGYKRGKEHIEGLEKEWEKAPLWRHVESYHGGAKVPEWFMMKVQKTHRNPLSRQIAEGVEIAHCEAEIVMNSKGE